MSTFGKRLRDLREAKGITLKELAVKLGKEEKNNTTISAWEKDKSQPSIEDIIKLTDILETTTEYLIKGTPTVQENSNFVSVRKDELLEMKGELLELKDKLIKYQEKEISELQKQNENLKNIEVVRTDT